MFHLQITYAQVKQLLRENNLPSELIDMVFAPVHKYNFNQMIKERDTTIKSIWWDSSPRLRMLCGERGALQLGHYDTWMLFPSFILFSQALMHLDFDTRVECFEESSCGVHVQDCANCRKYGFPCRNKVCYCPMTDTDSDYLSPQLKTNYKFDSYSLAKPNFKIESLWDIDDVDPRTRNAWYQYPDPIQDLYLVYD